MNSTNSSGTISSLDDHNCLWRQQTRQTKRSIWSQSESLNCLQFSRGSCLRRWVGEQNFVIITWGKVRHDSIIEIRSRVMGDGDWSCTWHNRGAPKKQEEERSKEQRLRESWKGLDKNKRLQWAAKRLLFYCCPGAALTSVQVYGPYNYLLRKKVMTDMLTDFHYWEVPVYFLPCFFSG